MLKYGFKYGLYIWKGTFRKFYGEHMGTACAEHECVQVRSY